MQIYSEKVVGATWCPMQTGRLREGSGGWGWGHWLLLVQVRKRSRPAGQGGGNGLMSREAEQHRRGSVLGRKGSPGHCQAGEPGAVGSGHWWLPCPGQGAVSFLPGRIPAPVSGPRRLGASTSCELTLRAGCFLRSEVPGPGPNFLYGAEIIHQIFGMCN